METLEEMFEEVREATKTAKLIAFDGCHKIYIAMTDHDANWFYDNGSYTLVRQSPESMFHQLEKWYDKSCGLKFINAVHNEDFIQLVPQGAENLSDDDDDDNEDE